MKKNVDIEIFQYSFSQNSFHALPVTLLGIESYRLLRLIMISNAFFGFKLKIALCLVVLFAVICSANLTNAQEPLTLQIHPYLAATDLFKRFTPLANYLSQKVGQPITIKIAKDYREHIDQIGRDKVDIAYMGPASYVKLVDTYGKKSILARQEIKGKPAFRGAIITRKDSPIRTLEDLEGKRFAFGDPNSTMSHLVPRFMLWKAGVSVKKLDDVTFLFSHPNVALGVLMGHFDAGTVKEEVFFKYEKRGLKVLAWTPWISEHLFVTSNSLPEKTVQALQEALYHLKDDREGRAIMSKIKKTITAMVPARDEDYNNLRIILQTLKEQGIQP